MHGNRSYKNKGNRKTVASSDMGDSGIGSPFRADAQLSSLQQAQQLREGSNGEEVVAGDSGLEEGAGGNRVAPPEPPPLPAPPSISSGTLFLVGSSKPPNPVPFKKRDTMIRELKSKLKEKFSIESSSSPSSSENNSLVKMTPQRAATMVDLRSTIGPKLSKVFESRRIQVVPSNEYESSIYDPSLPNEQRQSVDPAVFFKSFVPPPPPMSASQQAVDVPRRASPLSIVRESPSGSSASVSTVKEKVTRRSATPSPSSIENKPEESLQREMTASPQNRRELLYGPGGLFGPKGPFSTPNVRYPFGMDVGPASSSPKRNVHFEPNPSRAQLASRGSKKSSAISSEVSSAAEDRSDKSHYVVVNDVVAFHPRPSGPASPLTIGPSPINGESKPSSRIEMYRTEMVSPPPPPARNTSPSKSSGAQWKEEKNRRMLAWVNNSQLDDFLENELPFWKVRSIFSDVIHEILLNYKHVTLFDICNVFKIAVSECHLSLNGLTFWTCTFL